MPPAAIGFGLPLLGLGPGVVNAMTALRAARRLRAGELGPANLPADVAVALPLCLTAAATAASAGGLGAGGVTSPPPPPPPLPRRRSATATARHRRAARSLRHRAGRLPDGPQRDVRRHPGDGRVPAHVDAHRRRVRRLVAAEIGTGASQPPPCAPVGLDRSGRPVAVRPAATTSPAALTAGPGPRRPGRRPTATSAAGRSRRTSSPRRARSLRAPRSSSATATVALPRPSRRRATRRSTRASCRRASPKSPVLARASDTSAPVPPEPVTQVSANVPSSLTATSTSRGRAEVVGRAEGAVCRPCAPSGQGAVERLLRRVPHDDRGTGARPPRARGTPPRTCWSSSSGDSSEAGERRAGVAQRPRPAPALVAASWRRHEHQSRRRRSSRPPAWSRPRPRRSACWTGPNVAGRGPHDRLHEPAAGERRLHPCDDRLAAGVGRGRHAHVAGADVLSPSRPSGVPPVASRPVPAAREGEESRPAKVLVLLPAGDGGAGRRDGDAQAIASVSPFAR